MSFFNELKRRKVPQVAATYAVTAWLLMQLAVVIEEPLALPTWFDSFVIVAVIIGFPLTLILSWMFDLTPDGVVRDTGADDAEQTTRFSIRIEQVLIALLFVAVVVLLVDRFRPTETITTDSLSLAQTVNQATESTAPTLPPAPENSIAVLPFTNISNDPDQEYFSDGLTEELINRLSAVDGLLVTGRTSAFYFKGSEENARQIAESLGVNHILQGTVRKAGDQLRISATLMDATTGFNLWTDTFDRQLANIFDIQDEISAAVTTALSITFRAGEFDRPGMTANIEAYDAYLQGTAQTAEQGLSSTPERVQAAVDQLERAVALDPDFALAWLKLRNAYLNALVFLDQEQADANLDKARQAQQIAIRLAPDMRELLGVVEEDGSMLETEQRLLMALVQFGNLDAQLNADYASFLVSLGRLSESLEYAQRAYRLDPFNPRTINSVAGSYIANRRYDEAKEALDRALMLADYQPGNVSFAQLAFVNMLEQDWDAAMGTTANMMATRDDQNRFLEFMVNEDKAGGLEAVRNMIVSPQSTQALYLRHLPVFAALLDEPQLALEVINALPGRGAKSFALEQIWWEFGDNVRHLPEFKALVEELGFADYWRASGNWADYCRPLEGNDDFECF